MKKIGFFLTLSLVLVVAGCAKKESDTSTQGTAKVETKTNENEKIEQEEGKAIVKKMVKLETSMGDIVIELNEEKAPITVENFLKYVNDGFYDGTIFHRVMKGFMVQGGGFTGSMQQKATLAPIKSEATNGLKHLRGAIAMARLPERPHSATSQFFINHIDNPFLNYVNELNPGYAVFGKVVEGMDVVEEIANVKTGNKMGKGDVPIETVMIKSVKVISE